MTILKAIITQLVFTFFWAIGVSFAQHPSGVHGFLTQELNIPDFPFLKNCAPYLISIPFAVSSLERILTLQDLKRVFLD